MEAARGMVAATQYSGAGGHAVQCKVGCGSAALEKATVSGLALPAARSLALEKGAALSFYFLRSGLTSGTR
jgi:hypothetical protein